MKNLTVFAATLPPLTMALVAACGGNANDPGSSASEPLAQFSTALSGGDFSGNSVRICGSRPAPDGKYRCDSFLSAPDAGTADCPCFNFAADGSLLDPTTGRPVVINGLCPSEDFPPAEWTFQYAIFAAPDCTDTQLNDGDHNFTCFDSHDIGSQQFPDESVESLTPGVNTNHILCTTINASKEWSFESCAVATTPADTTAGHTRLDCGCTPAGNGTCNCGAGGVGPGDLEAGCFFDTATCNILCSTVQGPPSVPQGSCQGAASQSVLVTGTNVVSYVPKGSWATATTGISVVNVEGASITPTLIPTPVVVNSCASNPETGTTVCTGNNNDVFLLRGTTLTSTLTSGGTGTILFGGFTPPPGVRGPACTNCNVAMDAVHNRVAIGLSVAGVGGFQFLDLSTSTFEPPFISRSTAGDFPQISQAPLIDPLRNLLLSPTSNNVYEVVDVAMSTSPSLFERPVIIPNGFQLDSAGEDCATGIALAPVGGSQAVFVADLTQSTFTPGAPAGSWSGPAQVQTLTEAFSTLGAVAVAQGTHTGITSDGSVSISAIALPASSGSGTPAIADWVSCAFPGGFGQGVLPWHTNAYRSPATGHAIGIVVDGASTSMAVVDLTDMLDPTIVPRTAPPAGGHLCSAPDGTLPSSVVRFVSIP